MDAAALLDRRAQFFVLRYRARPSRDEARNLGVALIAEAGSFAMVKHLPVSQLAPSVRDQGILDAALVGIGRTIAREGAAAIDILQSWEQLSAGSIEISGPKPADLGSQPSASLDALYKALVVQRTGRRPGLSKGMLLDKVVNQFRQVGAPIQRGKYLGDFLMDAVVTKDQSAWTALFVESFAHQGHDWSRAERNAGYFLFALDQIAAGALVVLQAPTDTDATDAWRSYERVSHWISRTGLPAVDPIDLPGLAGGYSSEEQLALVMA